jgi:hypothetical protein
MSKREGWCIKKENSASGWEKRFISVDTAFEWFHDSDKNNKKGTAKLDSFVEVKVDGVEVTVDTATKTHVLKLETEKEAQEWAEYLNGFC